MSAHRWTEADQAELDLLVFELVENAWPHQGKPGFAQALEEAAGAVATWRRHRELRTIAAHLRARQDPATWGRAA